MAKAKLTNKPAHGPNGKMTKQEAAKQLSKFLGDGTFEIDKAPPPMATRWMPPEYQVLREKLKRTVEATPTGQAFIVPSVGIGATKRYLKEDNEKFKFVVNPIVGNDKMMRIYKMKKDK